MRRKALALTALAGGTLILAGCGIRTTQVPVDAGPAPSRMLCEVRGESRASASPRGFPVRVQLVCASQLKSVDRTTELPSETSPDNRVEIARALLAELEREPSADERDAGFGTDVQGPVGVGGPRPGDPAGTLRLSRQPEDLPEAALAQIVCTFAESRAAAPGGAVVLGGPGEYPPRGYTCSDRAKERPSEPLPTVAALPDAPLASPSAPSSAAP
ncbi:lipoprotein [Streptomyces amakusaensis]|uniref:Lipoprotein n=1 Tax=Streptomyces amakusaensis TaxID=67271 RepID=A0ABW0AJC5_9ACTN